MLLNSFLHEEKAALDTYWICIGSFLIHMYLFSYVCAHQVLKW